MSDENQSNLNDEHFLPLQAMRELKESEVSSVPILTENQEFR